MSKNAFLKVSNANLKMMHINRKGKYEVKNYVTETYEFCSFFLFFTTRFYHTFTELLEVTIYHFQTLCLCILTLTQTCSFQRICQQMKHLTKKSYMSKYCTCNYLFLNCFLKYEISMTPIYYQFIVKDCRSYSVCVTNKWKEFMSVK